MAFLSLDKFGTSVHRNIALDPSFLVVLAGFSGIVGGICGDNLEMIRNTRNLECFHRWFIQLGFMDIRWGNSACEREAIPINESTDLIFRRDPWYRWNSARNRFLGSHTRIGENRGIRRRIVDLVPYFDGTSCQVHPVVRTYRVPLIN